MRTSIRVAIATISLSLIAAFGFQAHTKHAAAQHACCQLPPPCPPCN